MKKYSNQFIVITTFIILIFILFNRDIVSDSVISSFYIWFNTLVPSMFPMFVTSDILINANFVLYVPKFITNFFMKLFNVSKGAVLTILISLISGFPNNALAIKTSFDMGFISKRECEHLLYICHFANPLFVLETVGVFYLKNNIYGVILLVSNIVSSFIIGIILRRRNIPTNKYISLEVNCQSFGSLLSNSIKKSVNTLFMISGVIASFLIVSSLICYIFNFNDYIGTFIYGLFEMTIGIRSLSLLNILDIYKVMLSSVILSFGGLSIHMQVISILDDKIRYRNYFIGRIYQAIISFVLSGVLFILFT